MTDDIARPGQPNDDADQALKSRAEEARRPMVFPAQKDTDVSSVRLTRKRKFHAWVGRPDQLLRIEALVEDSLRRLFEAERVSIESRHPVARDRALRELAPETLAEGAGGRLVRRGPLKTIMAEMDATEIERLKFGNHLAGFYGGGPVAMLEFRRDPGHMFSDGGVELEVTGSDRQWVSGTYDSLVTEIAKNVPWWSRLLGGAAASAGYWLIGLVAAILYLLAFSEAATESPTAHGFTAGMVVVVVSFGLQWLVRRWLVRDFEVVEPGGKSTAQKRGAGILTALGVVAALVTLWAFLKP